MPKIRNPKSKFKIYQTGFTLVEALVAITILLIGILGPLSIATRGITDGLYAQNQLMAINLAREGLEFLSAKTDENLLKISKDEEGVELLTELSNCLGNDCAAVVDTEGPDFYFPTCFQENNCELAYNTSSGVYEAYDGSFSPDSPVFTRKLRVEQLEMGNPDLILLSSTVTWSDKPGLPSREIYLDRLTVNRYFFQ